MTTVPAPGRARHAPSAAARRQSILALGALAAAGTIWGTAFVFGKWALTEVGVGHLIFYRFSLGSVVLAATLAFGARPRVPRLTLKGWVLFVLTAVVGGPVQYLVQYAGLARTTVSHASLLVGLLPALVAGAGALILGERFNRIAWSAVAASTLGAVLIALSAPPAGGKTGATIVGDVLVAASLIASAAWVLLLRVLLAESDARLSTRDATVYLSVAATIALAAWVFPRDGSLPTMLHGQTWLGVAGQGVLCGALATLLWNWGLKRVPASRAGLFLNLEPLVGVILGPLVFGDALGPLAILGGILIIVPTAALSLRLTDA